MINKSLVPKIKIESLASFLIMGGTPFIMSLVFYFYGYENSLLFVILTKVLLLLFVLLYFFYFNKRVSTGNILYLFLIFWFLWYIRVFYDSYFNLSAVLMLPPSNYFIFSFFFALVPFLFGNFVKSNISINRVLDGIVVGNVIFGFTLLLLFYGVLLNVHRLGSEDGSVNALVISYIGSMNVAYYIWKSIVDEFNWKYIIIVFLNIPVIGLGASKGGVVALVLALLVVLIVIKKINYKFFFLLLIGYLIVANASVFFLDTIVDRFSSALEVNASGEKEIRYYFWKFSYEKFIDNPFFGYFTEINHNDLYLINSNAYPHNIVLEAFLSMGFLGGSILLLIIYYSVRNAIYICKHNIEESWILLFFMIAFYQNMFSGNIYSGAIWFWFFVGLINGRYVFLKQFPSKKE
jgi:O-antigen ligase